MVNDNDNNDHYHYHVFIVYILFFGNGLPPNPTFQPLRAEKTTYYAGKFLRAFRGIYQELPTIEYNIGN